MSKINKILIGSNNKGKFKEIADLLPSELKKISPNYKNFERVYTLNDDKLIALIEIDDGVVKPKRIINY